MLNWMISYLIHHDSELANCNYENHFRTNNCNCDRHFNCNEQFCYANNSNCDFNYDYEQSRSAPSWRQRNCRLLKEFSSNNSHSQPTKLDTKNCKALEEANLKKGIETKITEGNKGFEVIKEMCYENCKGLGINEQEPIILEKKSNRKVLGASSATNDVPIKHNLTKKQRKKLRRKEARRQKQLDQTSKKQDKKTVVATTQQAQKLKQQRKANKKTIASPTSTERSKKETEVIKNPLSASKQVVAVRPVTASSKRDTKNFKALEQANLKKGLQTKITEGNKGFELLKKMGYENGKGLGKNEQCILEPIMLEKKSDRKGLGASSARNDVVVKHNLTKTQREKLCTENAREQEQLVQKSKQQNKKSVEATIQQERSEVDKKAIATPKSTEKPKKETELITYPLSAAKQVVAVQPVTASTAENSLSVCNQNINKEKFSAKDPCTPEFILSLGKTFNSEIELMQLQLIAEASSNQVHSDNDLIVGKIYKENNANIPDRVFRFLRNELVEWICVYQEEGMGSPIFHSLTNNKSHITIVCDNLYAFECLERCVEDILKLKSMGSLKLLRLPPISSLIYCFDAKYEGLANDSGLFLSQLHLHKPKLYSENWVVASHEVCPEERKTYFIFLIDERSALALNFHYSRSFHICMQQVTFRNRGIVRETIYY